MDDYDLDLFENLRNYDKHVYSMSWKEDPMLPQPTDHNENVGIEASVKDLSATTVSSNISCANRRLLDMGVTATDGGVQPQIVDFISLDSDEEVPMATNAVSSDVSCARRCVLDVETTATDGGVQPHIVDFISLDSDDGATFAENNINDSFEAANPEVSIKIRWKGNYEKFMLRKHQKFSHIMEQIAERENVPLEEIVLNLDNKFIEPNDTPDSIGYKIYHFIDGRAIKFGNAMSNQNATNVNKKKTKGFHLKVQTGQMKHPLVIELKKTEPLKTMFIKCAEHLNMQISQLIFCIDGEPLPMSATPEKLGLDCGEIVDMFIK